MISQKGQKKGEAHPREKSLLRPVQKKKRVTDRGHDQSIPRGYEEGIYKKLGEQKKNITALKRLRSAGGHNVMT